MWKGATAYIRSMGLTGTQTRENLVREVGDLKFTPDDSDTISECYTTILESGAIPDRCLEPYRRFIHVLCKATVSDAERHMPDIDIETMRSQTMIRLFRQAEPHVVSGTDIILRIQLKSRIVKAVI